MRCIWNSSCQWDQQVAGQHDMSSRWPQHPKRTVLMARESHQLRITFAGLQCCWKYHEDGKKCETAWEWGSGILDVCLPVLKMPPMLVFFWCRRSWQPAVTMKVPNNKNRDQLKDIIELIPPQEIAGWYLQFFSLTQLAPHTNWTLSGSVRATSWLMFRKSQDVRLPLIDSRFFSGNKLSAGNDKLADTRFTHSVHF